MFDIAVVGCGAVGLNTALAIQKAVGPKASVTIFTEKVSPETTSDIAAGIWEPYFLQNTSKEKVLHWAKTTQDYILNVWKQGEADEAGICLQLVLTLSDEDNLEPPDWLELTLGYTKLPQKQLDYYGKLYNENFTGGYTYVSFSWEASKFLPYLQNKFLENGGQIKIKRIENFNELSNFDVVVNSTGLNSRYLVPDPLLTPVRGQVSRVYAPWQFHTVVLEKKGGSSYVIPNQNSVILGGTYQKGDFNTNVDENDAKNILKSCYKYVESLKNAPVVKHSAGLRPARSEVRLELEERQIGDKLLKIVHNYGHGGGGITLSVGSAVNAATIVKEVLGLSNLSKL